MTDIPSGSVDLENDPPPQPEHVEDPNLAPKPETDDDDGVVETVTGPDGQQRALLSEVIKYRRQAKEATRKLTEQQAAIDTVTAQLAEVRPYVERMRDPNVMAMLNGATAPTRSAPQPEDDVEARQHAEDYGLIDAQGQLDIARARRQINRLEQMAENKARQMLQPLQHASASERAVTLREQAKQATVKDGSRPLATPESIEMAYQMLPPELVASPGVSQITNLIAAGIDSYLGRSPKVQGREYADPIFTETGRTRGPAPLTSDEQKLMTRVGLDEKELRTAGDRLQQLQAGRRGIALE